MVWSNVNLSPSLHARNVHILNAIKHNFLIITSDDIKFLTKAATAVINSWSTYARGYCPGVVSYVISLSHCVVIALITDTAASCHEQVVLLKWCDTEM